MIPIPKTAVRPLAPALAILGLPALVFLQGACPGGLDDPGRYLARDASPELAEGPADVIVGSQVEAAVPACPDVPGQILIPSCGGVGCHGANSPADGLDLASPGIAGRLIDRPAKGGGGLLVDPVSPSSSVLFTKLQAPPPYGSRMPIGGAPLDETARACVLAWIEGLSPAGGGDAGTPVDASHADAGEAAAGWTPAASSSTVLWLDASKNVSVTAGAVTAWGDLSSFKNDAAQSSMTTAPSLDGAGIRGMPAISFDETKGTFVSIPDAPSLRWGTGGYLVAIVGSNSKSTVGRGHGGGVSTVFAKPTVNSAVEITVHFNYFTTETTDDDSFFEAEQGEGEPGLTSTARGYNDGAARLYVARLDTSSGAGAMELRVNGVQVGKSSGNPLVDVSLAGSPVRIGSTYGQSVQGKIAEVVAMRGSVSDTDLSSLETYLMTKYALGADGGH